MTVASSLSARREKVLSHTIPNTAHMTFVHTDIKKKEAFIFTDRNLADKKKKKKKKAKGGDDEGARSGEKKRTVISTESERTTRNSKMVCIMEAKGNKQSK
jgi:hypothetical protein